MRHRHHAAGVQSSGENGGDLLMTGNATLRITAPTSGPTKGLAAVSDRNNTSEFGWRGNGTNTNTGTVYAKSGTFDYRGNGAGIFDDSLIVVGDLDFSGNNGDRPVDLHADQQRRGDGPVDGAHPVGPSRRDVSDSSSADG